MTDSRLSDQEANALVESCIPLAYHLARKDVRPGIDIDELASVAMMGLVKASRCYDPGRGVKFATYAYLAIRSELYRFIKYESRKLFRRIGRRQIATNREEPRSTTRTIYSLHYAIRDLPDDDKKIIRSLLRGKSQVQAAKELRITKSKLSWGYKRAITELRRRL